MVLSHEKIGVISVALFDGTDGKKGVYATMQPKNSDALNTLANVGGLSQKDAEYRRDKLVNAFAELGWAKVAE